MHSLSLTSDQSASPLQDLERRELLAGISFSIFMITLLSLCLAICICAEQAFSEVSAKKAAFSPAFSAALDIYLTSSLQDDINREISALSSG
jgi:hypothetical protein